MIPRNSNRPTVPSTASAAVIQYKVRDLLRRPAGRPCASWLCDPPHQRLLPPDVHRHLLGGHRDRSLLRPALQDRTHRLLKRCSVDRLVQLPLLDVRHEAATLPQRQPAPPSRVARIPRRRQAQAARHYRPSSRRPSSVRDCFSCHLAVAFPQRVWDAFDSWLRTIWPGIPPSAGRGQCPAPEHARISPECRIRQQLREIITERQDTDKQGIPARLLSRDWARTLDSRGQS